MHRPTKILLTLALILIAPLLSAESTKQQISTDSAVSCGDPGSSDQALFSYDGKSYRREDLGLNERQSLYELELKHFGERKLVLDNALWQLYLAAEAKRQQKDENQLAVELLRLQQPSEETLKAFYEANKAQIPAPYEQAKPQLVRYLLQQQMVRNRAELIATLQRQERYQILTAEPQPPIAAIDTDGFPTKGPLLAPVEIVEFADYQCPHCKTAATVVTDIQRRFGDQLRVVSMDFPINRSGISTRVAEGGVCAHQQDAYWKYHEAAFARQSSLSLQSPADLAAELGLDAAQFAACMAADETRAQVARSKAEALRLGLRSTPAFFVNGRRVTVAEDFDKELTEAIEQALQADDS